MLLKSARVEKFRSITDSGVVTVDPAVTVLVGQNESGKTAFLQAIHKTNSADGTAKFDVVADYPRKGYLDYQKRHKESPDDVVVLEFELSEGEVDLINQDLGFVAFPSIRFSTNYHYGNGFSIGLAADEGPYTRHLIASSNLPVEVATKCTDVITIQGLIDALKACDLNSESGSFLNSLTSKFGKASGGWGNLNFYVWDAHVRRKMPKFLYFDEYYLLPGKVNLKQFQQRAGAGPSGVSALDAEDRTMMSLLQMAGIEIKDLTDPDGYEEIKAKLESISISITDKIFQYWKQNQELEVEFDIRADSKDKSPFNDGNNLYIRIKNKRHRASLPFNQRSKGFIWFFSFIVWFENIKQQIGGESGLVLLLDEPGLNLHALAQADLLRYIDDLSGNHQIFYTTHSPFMVRSERLNQVRTVEDKEDAGTRISENVSGSDPKTIFPLQAALGYTIAQNLFISRRNLLVEGPADLIYLRFFSNILESEGRTSLREDITIVPVGGLDKVATFIALLHGNDLKMAVLHDFNAGPDRRIESVVREKLIRDKLVLHYGMFRNPSQPAKKSAKGTTYASSDVEDMLSPRLYMDVFNGAFKRELKGGTLLEADLPAHDRIVERINLYLEKNSLQLRPSGGFNHYAVANHLASNPPPVGSVDHDTINRFEQLFKAVNELFQAD